MSTPIRAALRIALMYAVVAACWILFTDQLLSALFHGEPFGIDETWWQSIKGLFFVGTTSLLLFLWLARHFGRLFDTVEAYRASEHRWQRLLNQTPEPVLIIDEGRVVYANQAAVSVLAADDRRDIEGRHVKHFNFTLGSKPARPAQDDAPSEREANRHFITDLRGQIRCIHASASNITFNGRPCKLSVWRDVTDRHQYEQYLVTAKHEAENASRLKSSILANLSHEIRTPLTAILGYSEVLTRDPDAPLDESIELIHRAGLRLKETLESILTLAEIESGSVSLQPDLLDLRPVVRSTAEIFAGQARRKGLTFSISIPDEKVEAVIDSTAVSQIVMNLVSNAVKFTDTGGVSVHVYARRERGVIEVRDTGIGIRDDFLPHIFDEFVQESEGLDRKYEGSGLGLTIVRQLVELHHGTIDVGSREGHGTRITVDLPSAPVDRSN